MAVEVSDALQGNPNLDPEDPSIVSRQVELLRLKCPSRATGNVELPPCSGRHYVHVRIVISRGQAGISARHGLKPYRAEVNVFVGRSPGQRLPEPIHRLTGHGDRDAL